MEIIQRKTCCDNWGSSIFFIANLLNFVLATAVFTIPFPMHEVGIVLGTIILATTCFISVIACTFIVEALALKNSMLKQENIILEKAIQENEQEPKEPGDKEKEEKFPLNEITPQKVEEDKEHSCYILEIKKGKSVAFRILNQDKTNLENFYFDLIEAKKIFGY